MTVRLGKNPPKHAPPKKAEYFKPQQVAEALLLNNGNATAAARVLGCAAHTVRNYCAKYPEVQAARENGFETVLDVAEQALARKAAEGEGWAVCFLLKTRGRHRGYVERGEQRVEILNQDQARQVLGQVLGLSPKEIPE